MSDWPRRLPPLSALIAFDAAFRAGNFTRAAQELNYSQATISRRIAELETNLGVALFERRRHDVRPTPEADRLAGSVRLAFGELASAAESIRRQSDSVNTLTVCTDLSLATTLVAPIIGDFRRLHPDLEIRILSSFEPVTAMTDDFDVGIQYGRNESTSLVVEAIADDVVFPVCSPEVAAGLPSPLTADHLAELPLLHVDYDEPAWIDWQSFLAFAGHDDAVVDGLTFTSYLVCLDVAERGEGLALGWGRTVGPRLDSGRLVRVGGLSVPSPDAINAYRPSTGTPTGHVDEFVSLLRATLTPE